MNVFSQNMFEAWAASASRREKEERRFRVIRGEWKKEVSSAIVKRFVPENARKILASAQTSLNLLLLAGREIAQAIYSGEVRREAIKESRLDGSFNFLMGEASFQGFTIGRVAIAPRVTSSGKLSLSIFPPGRWAAQPSKDWDGIEWFLLETSEGFEYFDSLSKITLSKNFEPLEEERHGYDECPVLVLAGAPQTRSFWETSADAEAEALLDSSIDFAVALSDIAHIRKLQSFKQLVIKADSSDVVARSLIQDPTIAIGLSGPNDSISVLDLQTDIEKQIDAVFKQMQFALAQSGITSDILRGQTDAQSGFALKIKQHKLRQRREGQRTLWAAYERRFFEIASQVFEIFDGDRENFKVKWAEVGAESDPSEVVSRLTSLVSAKIYSRREALRQLGHTEEQIKQIESEVLEEDLMSVSPPPLSQGSLEPPLSQGSLETPLSQGSLEPPKGG